MGCKFTSPNDNRQQGLCVIEVVKCEHLPNMDVATLTDAYVEVRFVDRSDPKVGDSMKLKTSIQWNSLNPVFHSFLAFPIYPHENDTVQLKLLDYDVVSRDDYIGTAEFSFQDLLSRIGEEVTCDVKCKKGLHSEDGSAPSVTIRLVEIEEFVKPRIIRKEFFVIRHGESIWNESQKGKDVKGMVRQYDHELTAAGIKQAQNFNKKWKELEHDRKRDGQEDLTAFLSASAIFASPLTRATQTALLTCHGHPALESDPLILLRNLREVKNFGSFDTVGKYMGDGIRNNVENKLTRDLGNDVATDLLKVKIDPYDAQDSWWTPLQEKESKDMVDYRFKLLWAFLRYGTDADTAILVGHSHFFRHMVRAYLSQEYKEKEPKWTKLLHNSKLDNAGCLRVIVEWDTTKGPMNHPVIQSAHLVFGSKLIDAGGSGVDFSGDMESPSLHNFSRPSLLNCDGKDGYTSENAPTTSTTDQARSNSKKYVSTNSIKSY